MDTVLYTSPFVPPEWILAHGFRPKRLTVNPNGDPAPTIEGLCSFAASFLADVMARSPAAVVMTTTCDQMRRTAELLASRTPTPVFLLNVPATWQQVTSCNLYLSELKRLGAFLESIGGSTPTDDELASVILDVDEARRSTDPTNQPGIPVALVGGPLRKSDIPVLSMIAANGGSVVLDGTEGGERTRPARLDRRTVRQDPLRDLATAYLSIPDVSRRPNSPLYQWLQARIQERQPRGIILVRHLWCDPWHAEVERLRDWLDIPLLDLQLTNDQPAPHSQNRIQAFMESLAT
jgi:benzoyl-CoA reductase/2-hydroxyglutaryl-CoA dehydratase subunit BcrC/BadD/HgdB